MYTDILASKTDLHDIHTSGGAKRFVKLTKRSEGKPNCLGYLEI